MAFRSHCRPNAASSAPTTSRSALSGSRDSAGPSTAVITASTASAAPRPCSAGRQPRVSPAASTMVRASTASTAHATKTVRNSGTAFTCLLLTLASTLRSGGSPACAVPAVGPCGPSVDRADRAGTSIGAVTTTLLTIHSV